MVFVDALTVMLLGLGASTFLLAMYFLMAALGRKDMDMLYVPGFIFGMFDFASGFAMSFLWPIPGAYNMLFGDPLLVLGILMMAGAYMLARKMKRDLLFPIGVMLGIYIAVEAAGILNFGLEKGAYFLPAFGLYLLSALAAILSPLGMLSPKGNGRYGYYLLSLLLVLVTIVALFIGYGGIYAHLKSPP